MQLSGKKILIGITGSIAAYKSIELVRLLINEGAETRVILTPAATQFVTPATLATISKNKVEIDFFNEGAWANHVMLGRWADVFIIAPLSCNTLAKMASGICDNFLLAAYLSATCPVVVAPAMDEDMWLHATTKANLEKIASYGNKCISVNHGALASGLTGYGRMAEPNEILRFVEDNYFSSKRLTSKKVLITAGPTYEPIDPVRFIGNHSSGKMGIALANEMYKAGAEVSLVLGPGSEYVDVDKIKVIRVNTAHEMFDAATNAFETADIAILAAAVADYRPAVVSEKKIKKVGEAMQLELVKTPDILKALGERKLKHQLLVGFALETNNELENAQKKLEEKNADMIVLNSLKDEGAGFAKNTNKITILYRGTSPEAYDLKPKEQVAGDIIKAIIDKYNA